MQLHQILYTIRRIGPSREERVEGSFEKELTPSVNQETSEHSLAKGKPSSSPQWLICFLWTRKLKSNWAHFWCLFPYSTPQECNLWGGLHVSRDTLSCPMTPFHIVSQPGSSGQFSLVSPALTYTFFSHPETHFISTPVFPGSFNCETFHFTNQLKACN